MGFVRATVYYVVWNEISAMYVGQTKNRTLNRFQGHFSTIRNHNTTVAMHFVNHGEAYNPPFTIHILEYIKVSKHIQRSESLRHKRTFTWTYMLKT